jgi:hypothetical protein
MEILGAPLATLEIAADQPVGIIAVRLNDVAPSGAATRVTYGLLNLTHHHSHERPQPLELGERYTIQVKLNDVAHAFPTGHKLRLAISTSYWPVVWPAPRPVTLSLFTGASFVDLPVRPPDREDSRLRPFEPPERAAAEITELRPAALKRVVERDRATDDTIYTVSSGGSDQDHPKLTRIRAIALEVGHTALKRFQIGEEDPARARAEVSLKTWFRRGTWRTRVELHTRFSASIEEFLLEAELAAYENDARFFTRTWKHRIKRDCL